MPVALGGSRSERVIFSPSAIHVGTQTGVIPNQGFGSLTLWVDVTINPGGGETIQLSMGTEVPAVGGSFISLGATAASNMAGGPGTLSFSMGPGVNAAWAATVSAAAAVHIPPSITWIVGVSGAGDWTYSIGCDATWI